MPYQISTLDLPCGERFVRAEGSGVIAREDADYLLSRVTPGGDLYGLPQLVLTQKVVSTTADARKLFAGSSARSTLQTWCAVVVTNPVIRVTSNFLMRVIGTTRLKLFVSEPEAIAWLDERAREEAARKKAP